MPTSQALHLSRRLSRHPYFRPHPELIPHRGPAPRGPQETSDRWCAVIRRRHCTGAESLPWCSVTPVLIERAELTGVLLCPLVTAALAKSSLSAWDPTIYNAMTDCCEQHQTIQMTECIEYVVLFRCMFWGQTGY